LRGFITALFVVLFVASTARATPTDAARIAHDAHVVALRTTLARAGIWLEMRSTDAVFQTCFDVEKQTACVRCVLADDRDATDAVLARITAELDRYPTELLKQAEIFTFLLCRRIDLPFAKAHPAGLSNTDTRRMMIDVSDPELEDNVHHEMFHMIESARIADLDRYDEQWQITNPINFSYEGRKDRPEFGHPRPQGFVRWYGMTSVSEDRATVYDYMMAKPDELCAIATSDPIVRSKAQIIWSRIIKYDGGDELMYSAAACVHTLARATPYKRGR
jgi:hypothetical protein